MAELLRASLEVYPVFAAKLQEQTGIDPEFVNCGAMEVLLTDQQYRMARSEVRAAESFADRFGQTVLELLSPEEARAREPHLTGDLLGAKRSNVVSQVRNPRLLRALRAACEDAGIRILEHTAVQSLVRASQNGQILGVRTASTEVHADKVVLTAGAWSSQIDAQLAAIPPVYPVRGQIALLQAEPGCITHVVERGRWYLVPRKDGKILVGATQERHAGFDKQVTPAGRQSLLELASRLVPRLGDAPLLQCWAGLRPGTPDGRPYIGIIPGYPNLLAATGHFRNGLTLAPVTGRIVAELVTSGACSYDLADCEPGRSITVDAGTRR
jgi:glycine oxidase